MQRPALLQCGLVIAVAVVATIGVSQAHGQSKARTAASASASAAVSSASPTADRPPSPAFVPPKADDVVLLKDGGMVRGLIVELVPDKTVTIMRMDGQTKQYSMGEVKYAGPAADAPKRAGGADAPGPRGVEAPAPGVGATPRTGNVSHLRLTAEKPVTYYVQGGLGQGTHTAGGYSRLCTAPCDVDLQDGEYVFALQAEGKNPVRAKEPVYIKGDATLDAKLVSRSKERTSGWVMLGVLNGIGTGLIIYGLAMEGEESCHTVGYGSTTNSVCVTKDPDRAPFLASGALLSVVGLAVGLPLGLSRDRAVVSVGDGGSIGPGKRPEDALTRISVRGAF